ncbi:MAG: hypothetical protein DI538_10135 [Azospira oryzae]|nr:MAG: hypothetical protein DI538_10135 [Azospira oryzae]
MKHEKGTFVNANGKVGLVWEIYDDVYCIEFIDQEFNVISHGYFLEEEVSDDSVLYDLIYKYYPKDAA